MRQQRSPIVRGAITSVMLLALGAGMVLAQPPVFQPLLTGHRLICAEVVDGRLYAGLDKGGLVEYDLANGQTLRTLTRLDGLGGHNVRDLVLLEETLWVATTDGGLTAISRPGTASESMRVYSSLLASLEVTAVAGQLIGLAERIYYGTMSNGIGVITSGLPGAYLSTQDGLIDDQIVDLAINDDNLLLIATPSGLSRFADNTFTNYPYTDEQTETINDLEVGPDGRIWAATRSGVKRWNDETRTFDLFFGSSSFVDLAVEGPRVWALTSFESVWVLQGQSSTAQALAPAPDGQQVITEAVAAADGSAWTVGRVRSVPGSIISLPFVLPVGDESATHDVLDACPIGSPGGFEGVSIDSRRRAWLGDFTGDGLAGYDEGQWYNVNQLASAENDSSGFFNWSGNVLAMARAGDALWFNQFQHGVIRFTPAAEPGGEEAWDLIYPGNSGMRGRFILNIAVHPDGPVFFTTDANEPALGVDVLIDPDNWRSPASWLHLEPSVLGGNNVWAVGFERRDVVWFAVRNVGLQRWDINGPGAGPADRHAARPVGSQDLDLRDRTPGPDRPRPRPGPAWRPVGPDLIRPEPPAVEPAPDPHRCLHGPRLVPGPRSVLLFARGDLAPARRDLPPPGHGGGRVAPGPQQRSGRRHGRHPPGCGRGQRVARDGLPLPEPIPRRLRQRPAQPRRRGTRNRPDRHGRDPRHGRRGGAPGQ